MNDNDRILHSMMLTMQLAYHLHGGTQQHGKATKVARAVVNQTVARPDFPKKYRPYAAAIVAHRNPIDMVEKIYAMYALDNPDEVETGDEYMAVKE